MIASTAAVRTHSERDVSRSISCPNRRHGKRGRVTSRLGRITDVDILVIVTLTAGIGSRNAVRAVR